MIDFYKFKKITLPKIDVQCHFQFSTGRVDYLFVITDKPTPVLSVLDDNPLAQIV
ncbi:hypothetical protein D3C87_889310 [compost metagenome]